MNNLRKKVLMMTMAAATLSAIAQQPVDYVNPIIGTNGMGHTFPGACTPFGWVQLSPDTDTIPHNVNGAYQKNAYEYCAVTNIGTRPLLASVTLILVVRDILTWETSC